MYYIPKGKTTKTEEEKMWKEGTLRIQMKNGKTKVAQYWCKSFEEGSHWGIDEGRISKLMIKIDGRIAVNYDRGWDVEPDKNDEAAMAAYRTLLKEYN
jgi:hypothetical protein